MHSPVVINSRNGRHSILTCSSSQDLASSALGGKKPNKQNQSGLGGLASSFLGGGQGSHGGGSGGHGGSGGGTGGGTGGGFGGLAGQLAGSLLAGGKPNKPQQQQSGGGHGGGGGLMGFLGGHHGSSVSNSRPDCVRLC